jgi:hypothetical protein
VAAGARFAGEAVWVEMRLGMRAGGTAGGQLGSEATLDVAGRALGSEAALERVGGGGWTTVAVAETAITGGESAVTTNVGAFRAGGGSLGR